MACRESGFMRNSWKIFTLVELLIVVSILAILAGLLLPALNKAREKARALQCIGNMRQMALGMLSYTTDSGFWIYPVQNYYEDPESGKKLLWYQRLIRDGYTDVKFSGPSIYDLKQKDVGNGILFCPDTRLAQTQNANSTRWPSWVIPYGYFSNSTYGITEESPETQLSRGASVIRSGVRPEKVKKPASKVALMEKIDPRNSVSMFNVNSLFSYDTGGVLTMNAVVGYIHHHQSTSLYADGHVSPFHWNLIYPYLISNQKTAAWKIYFDPYKTL